MSEDLADVLFRSRPTARRPCLAVFTEHGDQRIARCELSSAEIEAILRDARAVHLPDHYNNRLARSFYLFFDQRSRCFFVAVVAQAANGPTGSIVTILDQAMHERDCGPLSAAELAAAARLVLDRHAYREWARTINWSDLALDRRAMALKCTGRSLTGAPLELSLPIPPVPKDYFRGGKLRDAQYLATIWATLNKTAHLRFEDQAAHFLSTLEQVGYYLCDDVQIIDLTQEAKEAFAEHETQSRRLHRSDLILYVQCAIDGQRHTFQKTGPALPSSTAPLYPHTLHTLGESPEFASQLKSLLAKKFRGYSMNDVLNAVTEIQLSGPAGVVVDLVTPAKRRLVDLALVAH